MEVISQWQMFLTSFMRYVTWLDSIEIIFIFIPLVYWCIDEKKGIQLGIVLLISIWVNLAFLNNGSFPLAQGQNALVFWVVMASLGKKKWPYFAAAGICLLVSFSCFYTEVNTLIELGGAWFMGAIILSVYFLAGKKIDTLISSCHPRFGMISCSVIAFAMIQYRPSVFMLLPAGAVFGIGVAYQILKKHAGFSVKTERSIFLIPRFVLGICPLALLYFFFGDVVSLLEKIGNFQLVVFVCSVLVSFWVFAGAPWVFVKLRLCKTEN